MNHPASAGELLVGLADELDRSAILTWGERNRRDLPWRRTRDRWYVLVSEVMLQQTQVDRVVPKWHEFVSTWPTPAALAASPLSSVLKIECQAHFSCSLAVPSTNFTFSPLSRNKRIR